MATSPPITQVGRTVVITRQALPLMHRACLALVLRWHRNGLAPPPLLPQAIRTLGRAMSSAAGHEDADRAGVGASCGCQDHDWIGIAETSDLLKLSSRQTRRLAANGLHGVRCGSIWMLRRSSVLALTEERKAARS
jgi:hypothetical protein